MIGIDVHVIGERETGNETYTLNLTRALLAAAPERTFGLFTPHPARLPAELAQAANARVHPVQPANHLLRVPLAMPYALWRSQAQLVHVNYVMPPVCPCPAVVTVHDLSYAIFPQEAPPRDRIVLGPLLPISARRAGAVIAVSENTRRDIVRCLGVPDERITVIAEAPPPHIRQVTDWVEIAGVRRKYGLRQSYILAVGNLQPRKNLARLIEAFAILRREGIAVQLAIAGQDRWRTSDVVRLVSQRDLVRDVVFTDYVPDNDLAAMYSGAAVFAYPSLYEGFGLPVLEAMGCATPVVTSNVSSLPEVAGDAALLVDPTDVAEIAGALRAVLTTPELAGDLRARGLRRAAQFSWQRAAEQTLAVYDRVLRKGDRAR